MTKQRAKKPTSADIEIKIDPDMLPDEIRLEDEAGETVGRVVNIGVDVGSSPDVSMLHIRNCSACGGHHDNVIEHALPEPLMDGLHIVGTHYVICPTTGQTVYVRHLEE